jgi:hypothetical protein
MKFKIQSKDGHKTINLNRRKAIRERCLNCSGWIPKEVSNCEFDDCSLHPFRSGKGKQNPELRDKAIRKYCLWCMNGQRAEVSKCVSPDCPLFPYRMNGIDSTSNIKSLLKKDHIEAVSGGKN